MDQLNFSVAEAIDPFLKFKKIKFTPFRDASYGPCTYELSLYGCFAGFKKAKDLGWYNFSTFDLAQYEKYEQVCNGDLNWIIPKKFIAFSGPASPDEPEVEESYNHPPEKYVPIFKKWDVSLVIRLNKKQYNAKGFTKHGIKHVDLYFLDGSCPSEYVQAFPLSRGIAYEEPHVIDCFVAI
ncbi:putative dual specificity protein phosphatase CDC14A [Gregarina niphandrodes]|uniref:Dual specificity protein phosphatase CDC14A n=1 Tax=Gregarina niphandrodes TaxID=110365 RepID=A0A023B4I4_GRENI|nr:putative dual specificity protein phosphatase CDC14A [Gregarina niphandrodes]EZG56785.1 putative dual specificity protein phosphatase CDC14A [Gregarina niphandrodes]|eukprot:XP_011131151.1 putative dual specificity protein phosphatase CDC14A [Gregarina niphandrodes]